MLYDLFFVFLTSGKPKKQKISQNNAYNILEMKVKITKNYIFVDFFPSQYPKLTPSLQNANFFYVTKKTKSLETSEEFFYSTIFICQKHKKLDSPGGITTT